jgi:hypothetical protein
MNNIEKLMTALRAGKCYIKYNSMTSDAVHEGWYTLIGGYDAPSNSYSDKLVAVSVDTGMYEDIVKESIIFWGVGYVDEFRVIKTLLALLYLEVGLHIAEILFDMHQSHMFDWLL